MDDALNVQSFTSRLEECDERIVRGERNVARQRGIIAHRLRIGLHVGLATESLRQSIFLLEEMRKVRAHVLKYYGYDGAEFPRKPRLTVLRSW